MDTMILKRFILVASFALTAIALGGCNFLTFNDLEDEAPVRNFTSEQEGFGGQISVYANAGASRVAVSSVGLARYQVYQIWGDGEFKFGSDGTPESARCEFCDAIQPGFDVGALAFAGVSPETMNTDFCVVTPFNGQVGGENQTGLSVACRDGIPCGVSGGSMIPQDRCTFRANVTGSLGAAAATVFGQAQVYAQLLISDPRTMPYLYRLNGISLEAVSFNGFVPGAGFGEELVSKPFEGSTRFLASQNQQVHAFDLTEAGATSLGCLNIGDEVRALSWINDQVAVGTAGNVGIYDISDFTTPCGSPPAGSITCDDLPDTSVDGRDVNCGTIGSAVGAADVDGDGNQELLLGAPQATIGALNDAGAVYVVPSAGTEPANATLLIDIDPKVGHRLGAAVAGVPVFPESGNREEIAAGAPGARAWRLFLCSGQPGDDTNAANRCL